MGSPIRDSATCEALVSFDFAESGGCSRKESEECYPPVSNVSGDLQPILVIAAPRPLPALAPQVPEATGPVRPPGSGRLDTLYGPEFRRLVRELEVLKANQVVVPKLPKVLERNVSAQIHVPTSVTRGRVPVLDVHDVEAEGGVVFGSVLVERKAGVGK